MTRRTDSKAVKALWSIVLGLVLAAGQFVSAGNANPERHVVTCSCCSCAQLYCCARPGMPVPLSAPVSSQSNEQRVQAPALIIVALLAAPPTQDAADFLLSSEHLLLS